MIHVGDCREVMAGMEPESVDAIVTDPPYGLSFMGKGWDHGVPGVLFWTEALRVLKPGGHLLAFGGTRTHHRMTVAIEDAGFEIKDCLMWLHGQGFPKHKSLLKPAWEPIILAKKRGAGLLNIDGCRIGTDSTRRRINGNGTNPEQWRMSQGTGEFGSESGRWPANVCLDEAAAEMLDQMSGERGSTLKKRYGDQTRFGKHGIYSDGPNGEVFGYGDTGGASRFYYVAKASRRERNAGLEGMPERDTTALYGQGVGMSGRTQIDGEWVNTDAPRNPKANHHPTVKPIALMRWLVRLVTPPGGLILDPFAGSGSTGCAAVLEGFRFVGIEQDAEYAAIAERRIAYWAAQRPTVLQPALPLEGAAD